MFLDKFLKIKSEDSNSENAQEIPKTKKKAKKQNFRPWTKTDRYILLGVIVATTLTSAFLGLSSRSWKLPGLPRIKLPQVSFEKTYVFGPNENENPQKVIDQFVEKTNNLSGVYGFYVYSLSDPRDYGFNQEEEFTAASLIKLPVMIAFYQEVEKENINAEDEYILKESDKVAGAGSLYSQETGTKYTYQKLVKLMGQESDNTAFNVIRKLLGDKAINQTISDLDMTKTSLKENITSPKDIGTLFRNLWSGGIVTRDHRDEILEYLTNTSFEAWLPSKLPSDIKVSHKYGREIHIVNDAGIVFGKNPYIVVIMTKGVIEREADETIPELSEIIYNFEERN